jgi:putative tryptophan/tyrosine transport system substrate-binding protein
MNRRELITLIGGAATVTWPLAARAQRSDQMKRVGVLMNTAAENPEGQSGVKSFQQVLQQSGWIDGQNLYIDLRWGENDVERDRRYASELVALKPNAVLASGTLSVAALQQVTRSIPIVFVQVSDPVGAGVVNTLARPGGNTTGFMNFEYSLSGKWLELLKQLAPGVTRVLVIRNPANPAAIGQFSAIQALAQSLGVEVRPVSMRDANEMQRAIADLAQSGNGGLIVTPSAGESIVRDLIVALAAEHKLPAVYSDRFNVIAGGLLAYGPDRIDQFRRAAAYVDRILKGERPGDLPVQVPTKYELTINQKTAKRLGITLPPSLLATANEVIE